MMQQILKQSTNGAGTLEFVHQGNGRSTAIMVAGDMTDRTVQIEAKTPEGDWVLVSGAAIEDVMLSKIEGAPFRGRASLSGGGSGEVTVWVFADSAASLVDASEDV